ncbi:hypothetical protein F7725_027401, partial [Dissostichus mawsoni]
MQRKEGGKRRRDRRRRWRLSIGYMIPGEGRLPVRLMARFVPWPSTPLPSTVKVSITPPPLSVSLPFPHPGISQGPHVVTPRISSRQASLFFFLLLLLSSFLLLSS